MKKHIKLMELTFDTSTFTQEEKNQLPAAVSAILHARGTRHEGILCRGNVCEIVNPSASTTINEQDICTFISAQRDARAQAAQDEEAALSDLKDRVGTATTLEEIRDLLAIYD